MIARRLEGQTHGEAEELRSPGPALGLLPDLALP